MGVPRIQIDPYVPDDTIYQIAAPDHLMDAMNYSMVQARLPSREAPTVLVSPRNYQAMLDLLENR